MDIYKLMKLMKLMNLMIVLSLSIMASNHL